MSIIASINGNLQLADSTTGVTNFAKLLQQSFTGNFSSVAQVKSLVLGPAQAITLPTSPTQFVYIKNLHATAFVGVTWTPNGSPSVFAIPLPPGVSIMLAGPNGGTVGTGITALSLATDTNGSTVEMLLAG